MNNTTIARLFAGALALMSAVGWAESESVNGVTWTFYTSYSYGATVTGMEGTASDVTIPYMLGGYEVKQISSDVFKGNTTLQRVTIPFWVKSIGSRAFYGCVNLYGVQFNEGLEEISSEAFYGCSSLSSVSIPSTVTWIGSSAFAMCGNLRSLTLNKECPYRLSNILGATCKFLTSLTLGAEVDESIGQSFFDGCNSLSSVSIADANAKYKVVNGLVLSKDGKELVAVPPGRPSISIPSSVSELDGRVITACSNLIDTATIPGVKKLGDWVVGYDETNPPKSVNLVDVRVVRDRAFGNCDSLVSLTIPASVKVIGEDAFAGCFRLKTISVAKGNAAFKYTGGMLLSKNGKRLIAVSRNVTTVSVPAGVVSIDCEAFSGCSKLTKVSLPKSLKEWDADDEDNPFFDWEGEFGCPKLKTITVASGNKHYKSKNGMLLYRYYDEEDGETGSWGLAVVPQALTAVSIPEGAKWVGSSAFDGCTKVTSVTIPASMKELYSDNFEDTTNLRAFKVSAKNKYFKASKGLLLSKNGKKLIAVPNALTSVSVPSGVTRIENGAFANCERATKVSIPASVASIGRDSGLDGMPDSAYDTKTVRGMKILSGWIVGIDNNGRNLETDEDGNKVDPDFDGVLDLTGVRGIADYAFGDRRCAESGGFCKTNCCCFCGISEVIVPGSLKYIGSAAFLNCHNLKSVQMPEGVLTIGDSAFSGCNNLSAVAIPDSVTSIGSDAFDGCDDGDDGYWAWDDETGDETWIPGTSGLYDYETIPGAMVVDGWIIGGNLPQDEEWDGSLDLTGARGIAAYAFGGNEVGGGTCCSCSIYPKSYSPGLVSVTIPATVKGIGAYAFGYCTDLRQVTMPLSVKGHVASTAFKGCSTSLKITYLASVKFNANGGTVDGETVVVRSVTQGKAVGTLPVPVREGYTFAGWWTAKTKGAKVTTKTAVKNDVTYYARWTINKYAVSTPKSGGGTVKGAGKYNYGSTVTLAAKPDSKSVFAYWMHDGEIVGYLPSLSVKVGAANAGYTAVFRAKSSFTERPEQPWIAEWGDVLRVGVAFKGLVEIDESCRPVKFVAEHLPQGLSLNPMTGVISGVPTVPGDVSIRISAVSVAKSALVSDALNQEETVAPLDPWATGTFRMTGELGGKSATAVLTIGSTGKVSGKFIVAKKQYPFTASSYVDCQHLDEEETEIPFTYYSGMASVKYGSKVYPLEFCVSCRDVDAAIMAEVQVLSKVEGGTEYGYVSTPDWPQVVVSLGGDGNESL